MPSAIDAHGPTMRARRASSADIPQLVALMREFYAEAAFSLDDEWAARAFAALIDDPSAGAVWMIEHDDVAIGHVVLSVRFAMEFGGPVGYVDDLFVRSEHRRKGAARVGLDALVEECRRRDCRALHVEVGTSNDAAIALYGLYGLVPGTDDRQTLRVVWSLEV
jgi:ribosomal protein S18 acetylase RimI-like enzyme